MTFYAVSLDEYCMSAAAKLRESKTVQMGSWQSTTVNTKALRMKELLHERVRYEIPYDLENLRAEVKPFLPWADNHFEQERISGQPINPGETFKEWRYPASASQHVDGFQFSHSYAERYWPTYAGKTPGGIIKTPADIRGKSPNVGIRHSYTGLDSVLQLLARDPTTRQAYLPIFYPEDLMAARSGKRIPCTLGYHFIFRDTFLDIVYPMRSCDFVRHFRDDVYLTCRLLLWVLDFLKANGGPEWVAAAPGALIMDITSLHCFEDDKI